MRAMPAASVDLIYLDPPFNSNENYNTLYRDSKGAPLPEQIQAFQDTWRANTPPPDRPTRHAKPRPRIGCP